MMPAFLSTIEAKLIALAVVVVLIGGAITYIYNKGENAGSSSVTTAVQSKAAKTVDAARVTREKAEQETVAMPYSERVEGLR